MITDLPTRINKVADSLTKEGKYEKEKVATELDKQLKTLHSFINMNKIRITLCDPFFTVM